MKSVWTRTSCTWWREGGGKAALLTSYTKSSNLTGARVHLPNLTKTLSTDGGRSTSPLCRVCSRVYLSKRATNKRRSARVRRSSRVWKHNRVVSAHFLLPAVCVKGCRWHFTLISLKRRVKPYSFVERQVNTWTWRSFSFQAVLKFLIPRDLFIRGVMV